MSRRGRIAILIAVLVIVLGSGAVDPHFGAAADRQKSVMGIVESVSGTVISLGGKSFDLQGVPVRNASGTGTVDPSSLRGRTVEIVFRNERLDSVTVYRTLPQ